MPAAARDRDARGGERQLFARRLRPGLSPASSACARARPGSQAGAHHEKRTPSVASTSWKSPIGWCAVALCDAAEGAADLVSGRW